MKDKEKDKKQDQLFDPWDGEYIGNVWGWKFSYWSLALILGVGLIMLIRYMTMDEPVTTQQNETTEQVDSVRVDVQ